MKRLKRIGVNILVAVFWPIAALVKVGSEKSSFGVALYVYIASVTAIAFLAAGLITLGMDDVPRWFTALLLGAYPIEGVYLHFKFKQWFLGDSALPFV